jgi:hypothetical protein
VNKFKFTLCFAFCMNLPHEYIASCDTHLVNINLKTYAFFILAASKHSIRIHSENFNPSANDWISAEQFCFNWLIS